MRISSCKRRTAQALAVFDLPGGLTAETEVFRRGELRRPQLAAASLQNV
jgi:hypothetical protein